VARSNAGLLSRRKRGGKGGGTQSRFLPGVLFAKPDEKKSKKMMDFLKRSLKTMEKRRGRNAVLSGCSETLLLLHRVAARLSSGRANIVASNPLV